MRIDKRLYTASVEEIVENFGLYSTAIDIMQKMGISCPGACCGKNKTSNISKFVLKRDIIMKRLESIQKRRIEPNWKGLKFSPVTGTHYLAEFLTDEISTKLITEGILKKTNFIIPEDFVFEDNKTINKEEKVEQIEQEDSLVESVEKAVVVEEPVVVEKPKRTRRTKK